MQQGDGITLRVNGQAVTVSSRDVPATLSLARFLRERLHLTGTKISCGQGGCGACVVTAEVKNPIDETEVIKSVNSCLVPILSCDGWSVTTVEGLGSTASGLHPVQKRLAGFHGTQCGFCSPGMVMSMHSLREANGTDEDLLQDTVENILDGNLCRCTGYRPILDAFKSFSIDAPDELKKKVADIEDVGSCAKNCSNGSSPCARNGTCATAERSAGVTFKSREGETWLQPKTMDELLSTLRALPRSDKYRLIGGNTGAGVYDDGPFQVHIDVVRVPELREIKRSKDALTLGGGVTLNDAIRAMEVDQEEGFKYLNEVAAHWKKVANTPVRNTGTLAGNLMLKHTHSEFPSDVFLVLEAAGGEIVVRDAHGEDTKFLPLSKWLSTDMGGKVIYQIKLPKFQKEEVFLSFKITPRSQNAHAYVNAAFRAHISDYTVRGRPTVVFGGIAPDFVHAAALEDYLVGKNLKDPAVLKAALDILAGEVNPTNNPVDAEPEYRRHLTQALLYKFVLSVLGSSVPESLRSGAEKLKRGISRGEQRFTTDPALYPLSKPVGKVEGRAQCTGEAEYVDDIAPAPGELYGALVLATRGKCTVAGVDAGPALAIPGVVAFLDHSDVPGANNVAVMGPHVEEIFSSGRVHYAGQSLGLIVAESADLAQAAVKKVVVNYKDEEKLVLDINEAVQDKARLAQDEADVKGFTIGDTEVFADDAKLEAAFSEPVKIIEGEFEIGSQYHFYMETQSCFVRPIEDGQFEVYAATQWIAKTQEIVAKALGIPHNSLDMQVRRLGGAYGGKITRPGLPAAACAIAANKLHRPVRMVLDLKTNMEMIGKRLPYLTKYKVAVTPKGKLKAVGLKIFCDTGHNLNETTADTAALFAQNVYGAQNWRIIPNSVTTDTPANTYVRAPGTTQGHAAIEHVVEHVAAELGMDPLEFRLVNLFQKGDKLLEGIEFEEDTNPIVPLIEQIQNDANFAQRKVAVETFNRNNRWKKKGISLVPVRYLHQYIGFLKYHAMVSVYAGDGSVAVVHGGIEMGQGINTKVAQVVAKELGISMDMIKVKPANNHMGPNDCVTGGSFGSEICASAAQAACQQLKERMKKVKQGMSNSDPTWQEVVAACEGQGVSLSARHMGHPPTDNIKSYEVYAVVVTEVEVDVLTGEMIVRRSDILEDTGTAMSPEVDIGQVEGGYIMSLGLWLTERIKYDPETGRLLSNSTWDYKPPASQDIPEDLRTTFYDSKRNPNGVLGSKATGEPSVLLGIGVIMALRNAINSAKEDVGYDLTKWYPLHGPMTVEKIQGACGLTAEKFTLQN